MKNKRNQKENNGNFKDGRCLKKYYCKEIECNKEISLANGIYGKGRCFEHALKQRSIDNKNKIHSKNCKCCCCRAKRGEYKKENNFRYGKKYKHKNNCKCPFCMAKRGDLIPWNKNKSWSEEVKNKIRLKQLGVKESKETKRKISLGHGGTGIPYENYTYPYIFYSIRERIRYRDEHICQICKVPEIEIKRKLDCHHIDYNKKNNNENNLIALCFSCHMKTNGNREYWEKYFKSFLLKK